MKEPRRASDDLERRGAAAARDQSGPAPIVLLNTGAGGGTALRKWNRLEPLLRSLLGDFSILCESGAGAAETALRSRIESGATKLIAAGGDGTVNLVLNTLLEAVPPERVPAMAMGAVGLGSSNDFHKPIRPEQLIAGVPCRIDFARAVPQDVGVLQYSELGGTRERYWIINGSAGATAEANYEFNHPRHLLSWLKAHVPAGAIGYAALRAIALCPSREMRLVVDEEVELRTRVKNLGVVKNPNFTDGLRYDSPYEPASGCFHVHLIEHVSPARLLLLLARLRKGRFSGEKGTRSWRARRLRIRGTTSFAVEIDGEVTRVQRFAEFSIFSRRLRVCPC
jgi:diacylglycerol kinase (ATP)